MQCGPAMFRTVLDDFTGDMATWAQIWTGAMWWYFGTFRCFEDIARSTPQHILALGRCFRPARRPFAMQDVKALLCALNDSLQHGHALLIFSRSRPGQGRSLGRDSPHESPRCGPAGG
jgi:hypothetical protein